MAFNSTTNVKAAFFQMVPFAIDKGGGNLEGYMARLARTLYLVDNINTTFIPSMEAVWGSKSVETGLWNGELGMLQRNEADYTLVPMTLYMERFRDFASSIPFLDSRINILFGTKITSELNLYTAFHAKVFSALMGGAFLIYITGKLCAASSKAKSQVPWIFLMQCLLGTSPQSVRSVGVSRFLVVLWSFTSFVLLVNISSELTSEFASQTKGVPFDSMDDVFNFPEAKPILLKGSATNSYLRKNSMAHPSFREVLTRANHNEDFSYQTLGGILIKDYIHSGIENRRLFVVSTDIILWNIIKARFSTSGHCQMTSSKDLRVSFWTMFFNRNISSSLVRVFNRRLRQLMEGDCLADLNPSLKSKIHPCQKTESPEIFAVINTNAMRVILKVCYVGFAVAIIVFVFERLSIWIVRW